MDFEGTELVESYGEHRKTLLQSWLPRADQHLDFH